MIKEKIIALYITDKGKEVCLKLRDKYKDRLLIKRVEKGQTKAIFKNAFSYSTIIAVMATGIVVRAIAPLINNKTEDPAIIVIDESGKFVISLLSGHLGGANEIAKEIAKDIGGTPVITTSSDVQGYKSLDIYAKENGYIISDLNRYRDYAMAMTRRELIGVYLEKSEDKTYFQSNFFKIFLKKKDFMNFNGLKLAITWRIFPSNEILYLIPRRLILGMGFHKNISSKDIYDFVKDVCDKERIHMSSIKKVATIDKRAKEKGFLEFCKSLDAEAIFYSAEVLESITKFNKNSVVYKYHRTGNVAEASAYIASKYGKIIVPKKKGGIITACIALEKYL